MLLADINLCLQLFNHFSFHVTGHSIQPIRINSANKTSRDALSSRLGFGQVLCTECLKSVQGTVIFVFLNTEG